MTSNADGPILLFDGVCNLCTGVVRFVIRRDPGKRFRFASLQSPQAVEILGAEAPQQDRLETMILVDDNQIYRKSTAALLTTKKLNGLWPALSILLIIPRPIRDACYDWIGRRRYRMFGMRDECWLPDIDVQDRFLDTEWTTKQGADR